MHILFTRCRQALRNQEDPADMPLPLQSDEEITRNYRQAGRKSAERRAHHSRSVPLNTLLI